MTAHRARRLTVRAATPLPVHVDGEPAGDTPVTFERGARARSACAAEPRGLTAGGAGRILYPLGVYGVLNDETKAKARGRLRRIEGQVQGLQRMIDGDAYCVDILLQISAVQGALEQVQKLLLGRHIESCVADALRSGSRTSASRRSRSCSTCSRASEAR